MIAMERIEYLRKKIDLIDKNIVRLLSLRFELTKQIGNCKKKNKIKIIDRKRELQIIKNIKKYSTKTSQKFLQKIFGKIIDYSRKIQK